MASMPPCSHAFELAGGYTYEQRIDRVLGGLGFGREQYDQPVETLSGGQRTRAALARLLLSSPDLLLLDEPTNHLDLAAMEWLEDYLVTWPGSALVVAHDRRFLDKVVTRVFELSFGRVEDYAGNYTAYTEMRADRLERRQRRVRRPGRLHRQDRGLHPPLRCGPARQGGQGAGQAAGPAGAAPAPEESQRLRVDLSTQRRSGDVALSTRGAAIGYPGRTLFTCPELAIHRGDRVALIGPNGCGKTTLLRTVLGEVPALSGQFRLGANVRPGYYAQTHQGLDPEVSVLDTILPLLPHLERARSFLARYLFTGDDVFKRVGDLSGGERSRVALALLSLQGANLLIMDEPTNHLDLLSQEVLEDVLGDFGGTLLFVSHDRYFIDALATAVWAVEGDRLARLRRAATRTTWTSGPGRPRRRPRPRPRRRPGTSGSGPAAVAAGAGVGCPGATIGEMEQRLAALEQELTEASHAMDVSRVRALGEEYQATQQRLDAAYAEWEALSEASGT